MAHIAWRLDRIERALAELQRHPGVPYLGLCVNHGLHEDPDYQRADQRHPHWDDM